MIQSGYAQTWQVGQICSDRQANHLTAVESEIGCAAREADEALKALQQIVELLSAKLEAVLSQDVPQPVGPEANKAQRHVSSRLGVALMTHAEELRRLSAHVGGLLNRMAL